MQIRNCNNNRRLACVPETVGRTEYIIREDAKNSGKNIKPNS